MIEGLVAEGTTVLLTTQYLEEADRLAEHLVVINHGKVIAAGTPATLKANMGVTVLDLGLDDERDRSARRRGAQDGQREGPASSTARTVEVNVNDGPRIVTEALRILEAEGIAPTTLALREPSLDDVFLALTGTPCRSRAAERSGNRPPSPDERPAKTQEGPKLMTTTTRSRHRQPCRRLITLGRPALLGHRRHA